MKQNDGFDVPEVGQETQSGVMVMDSPKRDAVFPNGFMEYREGLVARYYRGPASLTEKLRAEGRADAESLVIALIDEVVKETDHLLGNELVAGESGDLRDASVMSYRRAEVLEKALRAVQAKQQMERERGIDIDSPAMMLIFRFFMSKVKTATVHCNMPDEQSDLLFKTIAIAMADWKKELKSQFEELKR